MTLSSPLRNMPEISRILTALAALAFATTALADGAETFAKKCAMCHGKTGDGRGDLMGDFGARISNGDGTFRALAYQDWYRYLNCGYRVAAAPGIWHYHPMPSTLKALLRMAWRNGSAARRRAR